MRVAVACALAMALAGCGSGAKSTYTGAEIKAAYFKASDESATARPLVEGVWVDPDDHQHTNYVPREGIETCPQGQRANSAAPIDGNSVTPDAGEPVNQFVVAPKRPDDVRTPQITQGALVFGTSAIADTGMKKVAGAMAKCPGSYKVLGGPSPILGTYSVSSREIESAGWKGYLQQIAHTNPADDVYYEDSAHVVVQRANVILYLDVTHSKIIGERSDASTKAESVLHTVLTRLG
ncbi:MAG TPA: hypothetical protein VI300_18035 [Solirubrobacter sp.]